jgi:parallel beta-helix repeat protein
MLHTHALGAGRRRLLSAVRAVAPSVALVAMLGSAAHAQTYYVDAQSGTCNNTGAGTQTQPYCTINAAITAHKGAGITIIVMPGTYREQVTVNASGASGSPFVLKASGPGVNVDGSDDFSNTSLWALGSGSEYTAASVTWTPKQVFVDGVRLAPTTNALGTMPANSFQWVSGTGLVVNVGGGNPGTHTVLVGHRLYGFNLSTKSFVTIDGFQVAHTDDRGINMQNPCSDLVISNNTVSFAGSYGIQTVNGQRITITGNTVSDNAFHGIGLTAGASACVVTNNECFRNAHPTIRQANGIYLFGAPRNTISGNRLHDNQDTGLQFNNSSDSCVSSNNRSYNNGDHGYDHLLSIGVMHVNDVAYHNYLDGFSFEGTAPNGQVHNCIATENGEYDLWVDPASSVGFVSDYNLFWNSTTGTAPSGVPQMPVKFVATAYATVAAYSTASGQDAHTKQVDPKFTSAATADFHLLAGSPAIDAAMSSAANWPATDAAGGARVDDPATANTGVGPVVFADLGAFEFVPTVQPKDRAPVVTAPGTVKGAPTQLVTFTVAAMDSDGDAITSLTMVAVKMPANSGATFTPNATNTAGTFSWTPTAKMAGNFSVKFVATNKLTGSATTTLQIKATGGKKHAGTGDDPQDPGVPVVAMSEGSPNPSSRAVSFALDLPEASDVDLSVYDMQGRRVYQESQSLPAGRSSVSWSGLNANRQRVGTGLYFVRAKVGDVVMVRRVVRF